MTGTADYGRYADLPHRVGCPRAPSAFASCIARDGAGALSSSGCLTCARLPLPLLNELDVATGSTTIRDLSVSELDLPHVLADRLRDAVREVTDPKPPSELVARVIRHHGVTTSGMCRCQLEFIGEDWERWRLHVTAAIVEAIGPRPAAPPLYPAELSCAGGCGASVTGQVPTDVPAAGSAIVRAAAAQEGWTSVGGKVTDYCPACTDRRNGLLP